MLIHPAHLVDTLTGVYVRSVSVEELPTLLGAANAELDLPHRLTLVLDATEGGC